MHDQMKTIYFIFLAFLCQSVAWHSKKSTLKGRIIYSNYITKLKMGVNEPSNSDKDLTPSQNHNFRQKLVVSLLQYALVTSWTILPCSVHAEETITTEPSVVSVQDVNTAAKFVATVQDTRPLFSDEFAITFKETSLGLKLMEKQYQGFPVVVVKEILDPFLLQSHPELEIGAIITKIGDIKVDGTPIKKISQLIQDAERPLTIQFRDPSRYFKLLDSTNGPPKRVITSQYLPANTREVGAPEQVIRVERLVLPPPEMRRRAAEMLDVLEIQYIATIEGDISQRVVDTSASRCPPGSSTKSIYYILGQRNGPPGTFPPGWDLTLRGMVVGETRQITLPYRLAYDRKGDKAHQIPPFANLVYTVKLVSLT